MKGDTIQVSTDGMCQIGNDRYPAVGFGTYRFKGKVCEDALERALEEGYRIIDTATFYENFPPISKVLKKDNRRKKVHLISKVWHDSQTAVKLKNDLKQTLQALQTDYLDSYFVHWPNSAVPIEETLGAMEEAKAAGYIRYIGLSNVTVNHLKRALETNISIAWIQIEMHPLFYDPALLAFCKEHGIAVQAWSPLARGRIYSDPLLNELSIKHKKTTAQIALRWIIQNHAVPLPASVNPLHIRENININDFSLTEQEMAMIGAQASQGERARIALDKGLGFTDEFDFSYDQCWPRSLTH